LELVDAATVVGGIRRLTSDSASEAEERARLPAVENTKRLTA